MKSFVLDASVALSWVLLDETNIYADAVLDELNPADESAAEVEAIVPELWSLEVANGLLVAERRGRLSQSQAEQAILFLQALPIGVDDSTSEQALDQTLSLARHQDLAVYDAAYLELALRQKCSLATADTRLAKVARTLGIMHE
ncbi:type II toxin-antitoxin system VapC family toxin [Romeria aff. gracilis LEGE 07310]|uniref:Type II toxin-antitoxin system VapC family toxin n=1 Tax=Vasconcelosia minhoensis LEGE 07310 TaxID=915328 RepID=A0A8J7AJG6_9CYAN|nr:type II toxin-antitoxin system VapC family toxin [Romeria gracilis]MBE9075759.1 type II toxin-antitoxin system VapC family toxin [Romeria aff. gracilis LEGE 07310]